MNPGKKREDNLRHIQTLNFLLDEKKIEQNENKRKIDRFEDIMDSTYKTSVKRLIRELEKEDVQGFQGLLVDLIDIKEEGYKFIVDIALKNNLYVFVVDTISAAEKIMKINSNIKGGLIRIFVLDLIEDIDYSIPEVPNTKDISSVLDFVNVKDRVDERVEKLVKHFLGKTVFVRDLNTAFIVSER